MKTVVIMEREFYGGLVRQNHKTGWLNANDMLKLGNEYRASIGIAPVRLERFMSTDSRKEFIQQIMEEEKITKVVDTKRGAAGGTWMHPLLFVDLAMHLNAKFKYEAMKWLTDNLLQHRDASGESYKEMVTSLEKGYNLGGMLGVTMPKIARYIKKAVGVVDWNSATEQQLIQREAIHQGIIWGAQLKADRNTLVPTVVKRVLGSPKDHI